MQGVIIIILIFSREVANGLPEPSLLGNSHSLFSSYDREGMLMLKRECIFYTIEGLLK